MSRFSTILGVVCAMALPTLAAAQAGDPAAGEQAFRQCQTCHVVADPDGNVLAGRNAKTGPNLYGVMGRQAGAVEDFNYSDALVEAGETGLTWDEESFVGYLLDPNAFLREYLDDPGVRSKMTFRVRQEEDALNLAAYLHSLGGEAM